MDETSTASPAISIGLPVYNGENFLAEALDCLLAQTFSDFEIIISDNASTDATAEICQRYADADPRIRYDRLETNVGAAGNYNRLVGMAQGRYFKWAAHDDNCRPGFLEDCFAALEADDAAVLCYPSTHVIDEHGALITEYRDHLDLPEHTPAGRLKAYLRGNFLRKRGMCNPIFGLIRTSALKRTALIQDFLASDRSLLGHLSLLGKFVELPDFLFERRVHQGISTMADTRFAARMAWFNTQSSSGRKASFNNHVALRLLHIRDYFSAIETLVEDHDERRDCKRMLATLLLRDPRWLARDIRFTLGFQPNSQQIMAKLRQETPVPAEQ